MLKETKEKMMMVRREKKKVDEKKDKEKGLFRYRL
jgi:hypothetical protein